MNRLLIYIFILSCFWACKNNALDDENTIMVSDTTQSLSTLNLLNERIKNNENSPVLHYKRAKLYSNLKKFREAEEDINKAVHLDSLKPAFYLLQSDIFFASGQTRKAKEALEHSVRLEPANKEANLKLAELYLYVAENKKSIAYVDNVLKVDMHNSKAYFLKGMNFKEIGDTAKAISNFQTVIEQDPEYYNAYMQLGLLYSYKHNPLCLQYFETALKLNPSSIEVLYARGMFYQKEKEFEKAIEQYKAILNIEPSNVDAFYNLGYIYLIEKGKPEIAMGYFTNIINTGEAPAKAFYMRGICFKEQNNNKAAAEDFKKALENDPEFTDAQKELKALHRN